MRSALRLRGFFPVIVLGIFSKRTTKEGAIAGILTGLIFTAGYQILTLPRFFGVDPFIFDISPAGIGTVGMILNFVVTYTVSRFTPEPPTEVQELVESLRVPEVVSAKLKASA